MAMVFATPLAMPFAEPRGSGPALSHHALFAFLAAPSPRYSSSLLRWTSFTNFEQDFHACCARDAHRNESSSSGRMCDQRSSMLALEIAPLLEYHPYSLPLSLLALLPPGPVTIPKPRKRSARQLIDEDECRNCSGKGPAPRKTNTILHWDTVRQKGTVV